MAKIYTSTIKSDKGNTIRVDIYKDSSSASQATELSLDADMPVRIEYNCDDLFQPLKTSTCSVSVITDAPLLDLYTGKLTEVQAYVYRNSTLIWFGYLSPNIYQMDYDGRNDKLTLEFVDPLRAMESVKFKKSTVWWESFNSLICNALAAVDADAVIQFDYERDVYNQDQDLDVDMAAVGCMVRNFVDETDDEDTGSMTWAEVLTEVCKYLNLQACIYGETLFLHNTMDECTPKALPTPTANDAKIALGNIYNKVTVVSNTNPIDSLLKNKLIDDENMQEFMDEEGGDYKPVSTYGAKMRFYQVPVAATEGEVTKNYYDLRAIFTLKSPWSLTPDHTRTVPFIAAMNDSVKRFAVIAPGFEDGTGAHTLNAGAFAFYNAYFQAGHAPSEVSWDKSVMFYINTLMTTANRAAYKTTAFLKYTGTDNYVLRGGFLIISLKWMYLQCAMTEFERSYWYGKVNNGANAFTDQWRMRLKIGNKYWNGFQWTTSNSTFLLTRHFDQGEQILGQDFSLDNKATFEMGLRNTMEGYVIPINQELSGSVTIELCAPKAMCDALPAGESDTFTPQPSCAKITDFQVVYTTQKDTANGALNVAEGDADITICNVIDEALCEEMDDVEMRVNTWDPSQNSFSYVVQKYDSNTYKYHLPYLTHESQLLYRMAAHYKKPRLQFSATVEDNGLAPFDQLTVPAFSSRGNMAILGITYDLYHDEADIELIEIGNNDN